MNYRNSKQTMFLSAESMFCLQNLLQFKAEDNAVPVIEDLKLKLLHIKFKDGKSQIFGRRFTGFSR